MGTLSRSRFLDDFREMWREQVEARELLLQLTRRDLLLRYRQAVMGFGWAVFTPVLSAAIFTVIFTRVVQLSVDVPYVLYAYAGLLPWNFFASSLRFGALALTSNAPLVTKVYFPREVLPFSAVLVCLVDFAVASTVLVALMVYYRVTVGWSLLFLPVVAPVHVAFTAGLALLLAMGNLLYRDVKYVLEVLLTVWMLATSVVYPVERVGGSLGTVLALNPMTPIIDAYRAVLLRAELPAAGPFAAAALGAAGVFLGAWVAFHRAEFRFAETI
jgi:ABC-type polysaccharide/polyol phosphate export permease